MKGNTIDKNFVDVIQHGRKSVMYYIEDAKEEIGIHKVKYDNEREIKQAWETFRKTLILTFRAAKLGGHRLGLINFINEEVKNVYQSERLEYLEINGGYGSFWGCKKNPFNHCK